MPKTTKNKNYFTQETEDAIILYNKTSDHAIRDKIYQKFIHYPYQTEFIQRTNVEYYEFLLWAKCRAGKSAMVLSHILDRKFKISLVVSRSKSPEQSWKKDSENFIDFDHFRYIRLADKNWKDQRTHRTRSHFACHFYWGRSCWSVARNSQRVCCAWSEPHLYSITTHRC